MKANALERYTALVPIYYKEKPEYFKQCVASIYAQTIPPDEFILVCDGELTPDLNDVIEKERLLHDNFQVLRLPTNEGAAVAFQRGMEICRTDLIQKLGSDDLSRPIRAEKQLAIFKTCPKMAVVGGWAEMFRNVPGDSGVIRAVPSSYDEILRYAKRRNPFNDGTVMYRKSAFDSVGGYDKKLKRAQDYDVYARILEAGFKVCNIPQVLCDGRENADAMKRRGSFESLKGFVIVRWRLYKRGFSSFLDFILPCLAQLFVMILPSKLRAMVFREFLRENSNSTKECL